MWIDGRVEYTQQIANANSLCNQRTMVCISGIIILEMGGLQSPIKMSQDHQYPNVADYKTDQYFQNNLQFW